VSNNTKYIQAIQKNELPNTVELLSKEDQFNEYIMTGLRTIWGVSLNRIEHEYGDVFLQHLKKYSDKYLKEGLLVISKGDEQIAKNKTDSILECTRKGDILKTTQKGKFLVDGIASELFMI